MSLNNKSDLFILTSICACFLISGFAALLYQTAWMRQFSVVFGTSELAIATVLAAYMAGLALGAAIAARYVHKIVRPILYYGVLEGIIAVSAILVPVLLKLASSLYIGVLGGQPEPPDASGLGQPLFYLVTTFIVLAIPTTAMGATLPMLTRYAVHTDEQVGSRVGLLYAINTMGAIGGTLTAAFLLLPALGLAWTVYIGAGLNLVVLIIAVFIARKAPLSPKTQDTEAVLFRINAQSFVRTGSHWILPIMLLSGAASFTYEVLWTRLLSHTLGGSVTAFATMLASFLGGIALGSAVAARFASNASQALKGFIFTQIMIGVLSLCIYLAFDWLAPTFESVGLSIKTVILAIVILFPATFFVGATFPMAVRIITKQADDAPESSAHVYSWNTVGAIVGATVAGFFLIPALKYEGAIKLAVLTNLLLACGACLLISKTPRVFTYTTAVLALAMLLFQPAAPENILRMSPFLSGRTGDIVFYDVGRSSTVLVLERESQLYVRNNGLPEASAETKGAPPSLNSQAMLANLPSIIRPNSTDMMVIGFGGGVVLENAPPNLVSIDAIELEPKIIDANKAISSKRKTDPLADERISIRINDARNALALTDKKYDSIVSQPSHPWTAGASHLFTQEFAQLAEDNLKPDGIFLQWMNADMIDEDLFRSMVKSLLNVFEHVRVYQFEPMVLSLVASNEALNAEENLARNAEPFKSNQSFYLRQGLTGIDDLAAALIMDESGAERFSIGAKPITDDKNLMATGSARVINSENGLKKSDVEDIWRQYSPLFSVTGWLNTELGNSLNYAYISNRIKVLGSPKLVDALAETIYEIRNPQSLILAADIYRENNQEESAQEALLTALEVNPLDHQARYKLIRPYITSGNPVPENIIAEIAKLEDSGRVTAQLLGPSRRGDNSRGKLADPVLATSKPTDAWYADAVKVRIAWRNAERAAMRQVRARESLNIIDEAIAVVRDADLYGMRFAAAFLANDILSLTQTGTRILNILMNELDAETAGESRTYQSSDFRTALTILSSMRAGLEQVEDFDTVPEQRIQQLKDDTDSLIAEYEALI